MSDLFPTINIDGVQYVRLSDYSVAIGKLVLAEGLLRRLVEWDAGLQPWQRDPTSVVGRIVAEARGLQSL